MVSKARFRSSLSDSDSTEIIRVTNKQRGGGDTPPPRIDPEVVAYLKSRFLVRVSSGMDLRGYDEMVGQQQVIAHLDELQKAQENDG